MSDDAISPTALAAILKPKGVETFDSRDRAAWLKMRQQDVTASVAGALFGVHDWVTPYQLFALKAGLVGEDEVESKAMRRGRLLEDDAIQILREDYPTWRIDQGARYYRDPAHRIGATPDAFAIAPGVEGFGVVQVKTVDPFAFRQKWKIDGSVEAPLWIAVQATIEALLTGASWACVAALVVDGGLTLHVIDIPLRPALLTKLRGLVAEFWTRVAANDPYPPDYARDGATIARVFSEADDDAVADLSGNARVGEILAKREALKARESDGSAAEKERKALDAELIFALGNASLGRLADGRIISAPVTKRKEFVVKANSFRAIKIVSTKNAERAA